MAMNRKELIAAVAEDTKFLSKADAGRALNAFEKCTSDVLKKNGIVRLPGMGSLYRYDTRLRKRPGRTTDPDDDNDGLSDDGFCNALDNNCKSLGGMESNQ